jgi:outer membrane protein assembly factor BamB
MAAFQIVNGTRSKSSPPSSGEARAETTPDLLALGTNLTARLPRADVVPLLCDLAHELANVLAGQKERATVRSPGIEGPWELGVERAGDTILVSLFRGGVRPEVVLFERPVDAQVLAGSLLTALEEAAHAVAPAAAREIDLARDVLARAPFVPAGAVPRVALAEIEADADEEVRISAEVRLRERNEPSDAVEVDRADLFSLLALGTVRVTVNDRTKVFGEMFVYLAAEQLGALAREVLEAWEQGRSMYRRLEISGMLVGVRYRHPGPSGEPMPALREGDEPGLFLTIGEPRSVGPVARSEAWTFRLGDAPSLVSAVHGFGRALVRTLLRRYPSQRRNLRLSAFRELLRDLDDRLREASRDDAKVNEAPERYRAFVVAAPAGRPETPPARLRFTPGWTATVAAIDLRATFLCGEHLIVGAARETICLDRRTGEALWRRPTPPGLSVVTPAGLARLLADGTIAVHDFGTGDVMLSARVTPRAGGQVTGAVVNTPGLPRLLVVTEGERALSAVDLGSGEVRWRHTAHVGKRFRMRRAGKLLVVASGDAALSALDLASGEVVWRVRDRLRFSLPVGLDHDSLFAVAGEPDLRMRGAIRIHHLDPYAGSTRWVRDFPSYALPLGAPVVTDHEVLVVVRDRRGLGLVALSRETGEIRWSSEPGLLPVTSAWLAVDDAIIFNSESGDLLALSTRTGATLFRHRFPRGMEGDQPRKLEPILRSGALFVPQQQVTVVRPRDGAILGTVPTDLIPDLLRVDERCDVYMAEDSGHIASFRAGARLTLV